MTRHTPNTVPSTLKTAPSDLLISHECKVWGGSREVGEGVGDRDTFSNLTSVGFGASHVRAEKVSGIVTRYTPNTVRYTRNTAPSNLLTSHECRVWGEAREV